MAGYPHGAHLQWGLMHNAQQALALQLQQAQQQQQQQQQRAHQALPIEAFGLAIGSRIQVCKGGGARGVGRRRRGVFQKKKRSSRTSR
jgi:hypothetical protein